MIIVLRPSDRSRRVIKDNYYRGPDPDEPPTLSIGEVVGIIVAGTFGLPYVVVVGAGLYLWKRRYDF